MTREQQKQLKELNKALPKLLKEKIKKYKFKKKDFMIYFNTKELFFDLLMSVNVLNDGRCYCTTIETIKPLWLDDLLWKFFDMENNKNEPMSLRTIGTFTVNGSQIFKDKCELTHWDINELEECIDNYLEHFYQTVQSSTIDDFFNHIEDSIYHLELRKSLTLIHNEKYQEAFEYLCHFKDSPFRNGNISIYDALRDYCKNK